MSAPGHEEPSAQAGRRTGLGSNVPVSGQGREGPESALSRQFRASRRAPLVMPAPAKSVGREALAVHERDYVSSEPLQALDALCNGLAAAIEDQLVHADRRESSDIA